MNDATQTLNEILDYFEKTETDPGGDWAFPDDYSSLGLDFKGPDTTILWLDIERDGTIKLVWRPGDGELKSLTFIHQQKRETP